MATPYRLELDLTAEQLAALRREAGVRGVTIGHLVLQLGGLAFEVDLGAKCDRLSAEHERTRVIAAMEG